MPSRNSYHLRAHERGTSLVELLIAVAILGVLATATLTLSASMTRQQAQSNITVAVVQNLRTFEALIQDNKSWQRTIAASINAGSSSKMNCLISGAKLACTESGSDSGAGLKNMSFAIFDRVGSGTQNDVPVYDGTNPASGFSAQGTPCQRFDPVNGNDLCPIHFDLKWGANCNPPTVSCLNPQAMVTITPTYKPAHSQGVVFNPANYSAQMFVSAPCAFQDVSFEATKYIPETLNSSRVETAIKWDKKTFDTTNAFSLATGVFMPLVAGKYAVNLQADLRPAAYGAKVYFRKNGTIDYGGGWATPTVFDPTNGSGFDVVPQFNRLVEMNGTSDYLQFYIYYADPGQMVLSPMFNGVATRNTYVDAHLVTAVCP